MKENVCITCEYYEKCNEHIAKAEKILEDLERYGA